ncbi:type II toxin-antitoxin system RelE/ParE family toxin [Methylobacterium nodulans]|uniref:Addiction module toxin RelE n=1 Tax=Methylobacterium nodulans (strain LMG 21967 / CNCM I-2342 / ORS 2060) TaxID=460265 RepID=B8INT0_METNO|nr:type II toxin-antitoxin system RelE/ParE family toxin [Methylobacterium nodulans]ACL58446.1 conserved hypothetical protein [Methylobacterium nodulans ORS 2060]
MQTVIETAHFLRRADASGMTEADRAALVTMIARHPDAGDVIAGTGGVRKVRFGAEGRGKSGSHRVITFFTGPDLPVFLITIYSKGEKANLSKAERNDLAKLTKILVETYRAKVRPLRAVE